MFKGKKRLSHNLYFWSFEKALWVLLYKCIYSQEGLEFLAGSMVGLDSQTLNYVLKVVYLYTTSIQKVPMAAINL
jgi:hypothetical protein